MSDIKWTPAQYDAISAFGENILVNAAAGSGKTAVLSERITRLLVPDDDRKPILADRLLVVTFTRAAAAEMRARIEKGIKTVRNQAAKEGDSRRLRLATRQLKLLLSAKITTIDSFCQSLVKEYFHILNIDPIFSVVQGAESKVLADEVFAGLCEELYAEGNENFYLLVKCYCRNGSEQDLKNMVISLYNFTRSIPYPEQFIVQAVKEYKCEHGLENTRWFEKIITRYRKMCDMALKYYFDAVSLVPQESAWDKPREVITAEANIAREISKLDIAEGAKLARGYKFNQLRMPQKAEKELCEQIKAARNAGKKLIVDIAGMFSVDFDGVENFIKNRLYSVVAALSDVTLRFSDALDRHKRENSIFEFSDIEQLAYRLLAENESVRKAVASRFDEILIDEYQDTNTLQDELFGMIANGSNLFMVGDMKQSIYRFRNTDPLVFRTKSESYTKGECGRKIALSENFRSRKEVLSAVNDIFSAVMSIKIGEMEYDDTQRLNLGNTGYIDTGFDYKAECVLLENNSGDDDDSPERIETEAEYIASRIEAMKNEGFLVRDKIKRKNDHGEVVETDGVRKVRNSDFVVLMSSYKSSGTVFREAFARHNIDCFFENEGYFVRPEIRLMLSLLRIIENPGSDIPMLSVLRSVAGGFSDEEIAKMRSQRRNICFYDILVDLAQNTPQEPMGKKASKFLAQLHEWRDMSRYMSAEQLARTVCEQTGLYAFFTAADGVEAQGNLQLFFDRAKQYESAGFKGLFSFLQYIGRLEENDEDLSGANISDGGDSVRIMTIHKSKGLEMPVVFVAGCGKHFNLKSAQGKLLIHKELGISLDYFSYEDGVEITSPIKEPVCETIKQELLSEEIRKLYVALTRAKEKLIVTACINNFDGTLQNRIDEWSTLTAEEIRAQAAAADGFVEWLMPTAMKSDNWKYEYIPFNAPTKAEPDMLEKQPEFTPPDCAHILDYTYPYAAERLKSKAAVSDFKGTAHTMSDLLQKPEFVSGGDAINGAEFGTAVHKILETLPEYNATNIAQIRKHIEDMVNAGVIREKLLKIITPQKIAGFYCSEIGQRILASDEVHRESEFEISVDSQKLYGDDAFCGEQSLLQGVIDCWFLEGDEIVLVDYKTDRVTDIDEIHQKYDNQIALYAYALEKITKKNVKEKFIYLFSKDCVIQC